MVAELHHADLKLLLGSQLGATVTVILMDDTLEYTAITGWSNGSISNLRHNEKTHYKENSHYNKGAYG